MQIEAGKFYRTRDGRKVGPMVWCVNSNGYPWEGRIGLSFVWWQGDGRLPNGNGQSALDLVAEWTDEQPAVSPTLAQDGETHAEGTETAADAETPSTDAGNGNDGGFAPEHVGERYTITIPVAKLTGENGATGTASIKIIQTSADGVSTVEVGDPLPPVDDEDDTTVSPPSFDVFTDLDVKPLRVQLLVEGATLTHGARDREYGPPALNMACSGELKAVFRKHLRRSITDAEMEALDMALTKVGRLATGNPKRDTYVDAATYMAIAGEIALTEGE